MKEEARKALKASLIAAAPGMPADLKAALKREARSRARSGVPSFFETVRAALGAAPWSYGLGAAFAAAALVLAVRSSVAPRPETALSAPAPSREVAARMAKISADLWSDDDGSDRDD